MCSSDLGSPGADGQDGDRGTDGRDGAPGDRGAEGPEGYAPVNGEKGQRGPSGSIGPRGPTGTRGRTGVAGHCITTPEYSRWVNDVTTWMTEWTNYMSDADACADWESEGRSLTAKLANYERSITDLFEEFDGHRDVWERTTKSDLDHQWNLNEDMADRKQDAIDQQFTQVHQQLVV